MAKTILGIIFIVGIVLWALYQLGKGSSGPPSSSSSGSNQLDMVDDMMLYDEVNPPGDDDLLS